MYWHKVKTMLIVLFALINAFLIGMICYGKIQDVMLIKKMNNDTRAVLIKNGITFEGDIPRQAGEIPSALVLAAFSDEEAAVGAFLGGEAEDSRQKDGGTLYVKGDKSLFVYGSYIDFQNSGAKAAVTPTKKDIKTAEKLLQNMGLGLGNARGEVRGDKIVFTYRADKNRKIFAELEVELTEGAFKSAKGYALLAADGGEKIKIRPAAEALVEFVQNNQSATGGNLQIKSIELGYTLFLGGEAVAFTSAEAIPAWVITLKNGQNIYYDARKNV